MGPGARAARGWDVRPGQIVETDDLPRTIVETEPEPGVIGGSAKPMRTVCCRTCGALIPKHHEEQHTDWHFKMAEEVLALVQGEIKRLRVPGARLLAEDFAKYRRDSQEQLQSLARSLLRLEEKVQENGRLCAQADTILDRKIGGVARALEPVREALQALRSIVMRLEKGEDDK